MCKIIGITDIFQRHFFFTIIILQEFDLFLFCLQFWTKKICNNSRNSILRVQKNGYHGKVQIKKYTGLILQREIKWRGSLVQSMFGVKNCNKFMLKSVRHLLNMFISTFLLQANYRSGNRKRKKECIYAERNKINLHNPTQRRYSEIYNFCSKMKNLAPSRVGSHNKWWYTTTLNGIDVVFLS